MAIAKQGKKKLTEIIMPSSLLGFGKKLIKLCSLTEA